jgi:hypothetical protein
MPDRFNRPQCIDFLRPLAFTIWESNALRLSVCEIFKLPDDITQSAFSNWLRSVAENRSKVLNLHLVALWVYANRTGQTWYI